MRDYASLVKDQNHLLRGISADLNPYYERQAHFLSRVLGVGALTPAEKMLRNGVPVPKTRENKHLEFLRPDRDIVSRAFRSALDYPTNRAFLRFLESPVALSAAETRVKDSTRVRAFLDPLTVLDGELSDSESGAANLVGHLSPSDVVEALTLTDIVKDVSAEDAVEFHNHLVQYPMLPLASPVGQRVFEGIRGVECMTIPTGVTLYRARKRDRAETPLTVLEMWEPPFGKADQGRFNSHGQSVLYTCDALDATLAEIREDADLVADVVELKSTKPIRCLKLVGEAYPLFKYCRLKASEGKKMDPAYVIPNFLGQCSQYHGLEAIGYESVEYPEATAYVFFGGFKDWFESRMVTGLEGKHVDAHEEQ